MRENKTAQTDICFGKNMYNGSLNLYCVKACVEVIENVSFNCELTTLRSLVVTILTAKCNIKTFHFLPLCVYL
jgi:hypothetical protein